jgi:hypothetical protein
MSTKRSTGVCATAAIKSWMPLEAEQVAQVGIVLIGVMLSYLVH